MGVPGGFVPIIGQPIEPGRGDTNANDDVHLRSARAIAGYQVHAVDGAVGLVSDFMVDETTWSIRTIEVETGRWYSPKHVRLSPRDIERISYQRSAVYAAVTQQDVQATADGGIVSVGREFRAGIPFAE